MHVLPLKTYFISSILQILAITALVMRAFSQYTGKTTAEFLLTLETSDLSRSEAEVFQPAMSGLDEKATDVTVKSFAFSFDINRGLQSGFLWRHMQRGASIKILVPVINKMLDFREDGYREFLVLPVLKLHGGSFSCKWSLLISPPHPHFLPLVY